MDWTNELSSAARERLARVRPLSDEEKAAAADAAALDEILRLFFKDEIKSDDLLAQLKIYEAAHKWDILRTARERLHASFKAAELRIGFAEKPDGSMTVTAEDLPVAAKSSELEVEVIELTDATFDAAVRDNPQLVVDCWAVWCGPCRMVAPVIEELAKDYEGRIAFGKLDVDKNPATASRFHVQSIPTILMFKNGKLVDQKMGAMPKAMLEPIVTKHMDLGGTPPASAKA